MKKLTSPIPLLLLLLVTSSAALGQGWPLEGLLIRESPMLQAGGMVIPDGAGGTYLFWVEIDVNYVEGGIFVQHIDGLGEPLWGDGVLVAEGAADYLPMDLVLEPEGGVLLLWKEFAGGNFRLVVQRLESDGSIYFLPDGLSVTTDTANKNGARIVADGSGMAFVVWMDYRNSDADIYAQRLDVDNGNRLWGDGALAVDSAPGQQEAPQLVANGDGSSTIIWKDNDNIRIMSQILTVNGGLIYPQPVDLVGPTFSVGLSHPQMVSRSDGTYYLLFHYFENTWTNFYAMLYSGVDQLWGNFRSIEQISQQSYWAPEGTVDPATGDLVVVWSDERDDQGGLPSQNIFIQRYSESSHPLYPPNGLVVCRAVDQQYSPMVTVDQQGYAVVRWADRRTGNGWDEIFAQRVGRQGQLMWQEDGRMVIDRAGEQKPLAIVPGTDGGTFLLYEENYPAQLRLQRLEPSHGYTGFPEPSIDLLGDVPGDQGGHLRLEWAASQRDIQPDREISHYSVWRATGQALNKRSVPVVEAAQITQGFEGEALRLAANGDFYWEYVGQQDAMQFPHYGFDVPTLADSTSVDDAQLFVQVLAHASETGVYFASTADSASSTDDLAPGVPSALVALRQPDGSVDLTWRPVGDQDLHEFSVFRRGGSQVDPEPSFLIAATSDTALTDLNAPVGEQLAYVVAAVDVHENQGQASNVAVVGTASAVDQAPQLRLAITQAVPNPFNPSTTIHFSLDQAGPVRLRIYDVHGRLVRTLADENQVAGMHSDIWRGRNDEGKAVSSGVYFARVETADGAAVRKLVLAK